MQAVGQVSWLPDHRSPPRLPTEIGSGIVRGDSPVTVAGPRRLQMPLWHLTPDFPFYPGAAARVPNSQYAILLANYTA